MDTEIVVNHVANSSLAGQEQRFAKQCVTVGRDAGGDVDFDPDEDLIVSHKHAEIYVEDGKLFLRDLNSRNGTYVNQRRISEPTELQPDDAVHFGFSGPQIHACLFDPNTAPAPRQTLLARMFTLAPGKVPAPPDKPTPEAARPAPHSSPSIPSIGPLPRAKSGSSWLRWTLLAFLGAALFFGGATVKRWLPVADSKKDSKPAASVTAAADEKIVAALGRIEPEGGILSIAAPAGLTVAELKVAEGQTVHRGDALAHLNTYDAMLAEVEAAETALEEAKAQLLSTKKFAQATVDEAKAGVDQAGKPLDLQMTGMDAQISLLQSHLDSAIEERKQTEATPGYENSPQLARLKLTEQTANRELTAAKKKLELLKASTPLDRARAATALKTAEANQARLENAVTIKSAEKNLERVNAHLEQAIVRAPAEGKILKILTRSGEAPGPRPILLMGDTRQFVVVAEIYETNVRRVSKGQPATIESPALAKKLRGKVDQVLWTVERNTIRDMNPLSPEDLRVVEAKIRINDEDAAKHRELLERLIRLQVDVRITVE